MSATLAEFVHLMIRILIFLLRSSIHTGQKDSRGVVHVTHWKSGWIRRNNAHSEGQLALGFWRKPVVTSSQWMENDLKNWCFSWVGWSRTYWQESRTSSAVQSHLGLRSRVEWSIAHVNEKKPVDSALQQARRFDEEYIIGTFLEDGGQGCEEAAEHGLLLRQRESLLAQYSVSIFLRSKKRKRRSYINIWCISRKQK